MSLKHLNTTLAPIASPKPAKRERADEPPTVAPATDQELKLWREYPCGDTDCRCNALHLDKAMARIEADRAENDRLRARIKELEAARLILEWQ